MTRIDPSIGIRAFLPLLYANRRPVAAAEQREAAFEDAVLANPVHAVCLAHRVAWFYDGCAAERSLARLGSCYR
jgi:hypothetical protein